MKKAYKILLITYIFIFFFITKSINILPLTISLSMYLLLNSIFSELSIKEKLEEYNELNKYIERDNIFKYSIITISLLGIILIIISYLIGDIININKLEIINIFMSITVILNIIIKIIKEYLEVLGYKRISNNLIPIYYITILTLNIIICILLFKVFKLEYYINYIILYSVNILTFMLIVVALIILLRNKNKIKYKVSKKNDYIKEIKEIITNNQTETIYNITKYTYIYTSVIILYYVLTNKYGYSYDKVGDLITNTYLYGLIMIGFINNIISNYLNINYENIKETFISNINKIIKVSLNLSILLLVISLPLSNIIFKENNIIAYLIPLLLFNTLYNYIIKINIKNNKDKYTNIIIIIGLITKVIFEIPLINSLYRMGYSLVLGSILSSILGLIISIILGLIFIKVRYKLNLLHNFNNILNITYDSIIYTLVLVIFTLIIKLEQESIIANILVIIFYIFITVLYHIIKRIITRK